MNIVISNNDGVPIYQQIVIQVKMLIASRQLVSGDELPPIRTLADQLLINPNTVARAYRELEVAGAVVKRGTIGTYVSDSASPLKKSERLKIIRERVDALIAEANHLNVSIDEVMQLIRVREKAKRV